MHRCQHGLLFHECVTCLRAENERMRAALVEYAEAWDAAPEYSHSGESLNAQETVLALGRELAKRRQP